MDSDDPKYNLSDNNDNFTRGHGIDGMEPSVKEYLARAGVGSVQEPQEMRVTIVHEGLDNMQVRGLEPHVAQQFADKLGEATRLLGGVAMPKSHSGFR